MITNWKKIKEEEYKAGYRTLIKKTFKLPSGEIADYDIKKEGPDGCVLPITADNKVVLVKQFRPGPEKIVMDLPGGKREGNETIEESIKREFLEETGYAGDFELASTSLDCAYSTMLRYNYVAKNCHRVQEQKLDGSEFIEVVEMSLDKFREHLRSGELTDVETGYLGLDYLGLL